MLACGRMLHWWVALWRRDKNGAAASREKTDMGQQALGRVGLPSGIRLSEKPDRASSPYPTVGKSDRASPTERHCGEGVRLTLPHRGWGLILPHEGMRLILPQGEGGVSEADSASWGAGGRFRLTGGRGADSASRGGGG